MKLILEITTKDDKTSKHVCNDMPYFGGEFITLYKEGFVRELIRTETVSNIKQYFKR